MAVPTGTRGRNRRRLPRSTPTPGHGSGIPSRLRMVQPLVWFPVRSTVKRCPPPPVPDNDKDSQAHLCLRTACRPNRQMKPNGPSGRSPGGADGSRGAQANAGTAHIRPSRTKTTRMTSTTPNPPVGPYPQFLLCGQVGRAPSNIRMSKTTKTVPNINVLSTSEWVQPTRPQRLCAV